MLLYEVYGELWVCGIGWVGEDVGAWCVGVSDCVCSGIKNSLKTFFVYQEMAS